MGAPSRRGLCQWFVLLVLLEVGLGNKLFHSWKLDEDTELISHRLLIQGDCEDRLVER